MTVATGSLAFIGAARFQGTWDADANTGVSKPSDTAYSGLLTSATYDGGGNLTAAATYGSTPLAALGAPKNGDYWQISNASSTPSENTTIDSINDWEANDWIIYSGSQWIKLSYQDTIASIVTGDIDGATGTWSFGTVGIGTTSPQSPLHISAADNTTWPGANAYSDEEYSNFLLTLENKSNTDESFAGIAFNTTTEHDADSISAAIMAVSDNTTSTDHRAALVFATNNKDSNFNTSDDGLAERMRIEPDGDISIHGDFTVYDRGTSATGNMVAGGDKLMTVSRVLTDTTYNDDAILQLFENNTARVRLSAMDNTSYPSYVTYRFGVGTATPEYLFEVSDDGTDAVAAVSQYNDAASGPDIYFRKARGTEASPTSVSENDSLGSLKFYGYNADGTAFDKGAEIEVFVDGEPSTSTDSSDMPARIEFKVSADGVSNPTTVMTVAKYVSGPAVGIGTDSPTENLHVAGTFKATGNVTLGDAAADTVTIPGDLKVDTDTLYVDVSEDSVGIGTTTPSSILELSSDSSTDLTLTQANSNITSPLIVFQRSRGSIASKSACTANGDRVGAIEFKAYDGDAYNKVAEIRAEIGATAGDNDSPGELKFYTTANGATSPTERMTITESGKVGIGTNSPDSLLDIESTSTQLRLTHTNSTDYATFAVDGDGQLDITTVDGGGAGGHICLLPDGSVGIGTDAPGQLLHVATPNDGEGIKAENTSTGAAFEAKYISGAGHGYQLKMDDNNNSTTIFLRSYGNSYFNTGGSFGIGTASPDSSAILDLTSTTKGFLLPRLTTTQRDAVSSPAEGLVVYNDSTNALNFYNGSSWAAVGTGGGAVSAINNATENELVTIGSTTTELDAEANLTYDGTTLTVGGHILPGSDNDKDLGSAAKRWANIYTGDLHLKNERGDWTIIEEEEFLSITNNKNGKRYKFVLEELE